MATITQQRTRDEIDDRIAIIEDVKRDLKTRLDHTKNKIHSDYLKEKIRGINTELRIMCNMRTALQKTIRQSAKKK